MRRSAPRCIVRSVRLHTGPNRTRAGRELGWAGAPLSHAVIVSRELGIPCVVSVTDATRRIPDGVLVTVDGDTGTVTVAEDAVR